MLFKDLESGGKFILLSTIEDTMGLRVYIKLKTPVEKERYTIAAIQESSGDLMVIDDDTKIIALS